MTDAADRLMQWLRDAHAMEKQAEQMLSGLSMRLKNYPEIKARIDQHIEETRNQITMIDRCIKARGGDASRLKDFAGQVLGTGQALSGMFAGDEIMKGVLASYAFEHMEIASYTIILAAALELGDQQTAMTCRQILSEEEAMADWLLEHMADVTHKFLAREERPHVEAKR